MTGETLKIMLMIALFASLEGALYYARIRASFAALLRLAPIGLWSMIDSNEYAMQPIRIVRRTISY
jgi:hypothetical protein